MSTRDDGDTGRTTNSPGRVEEGESQASSDAHDESRRRILHALAGGFGLLAVGVGRSMGRSLLVVEESGGSEPPAPKTKSVSQTNSVSFTYSNSWIPSYSVTDSYTSPGSGTSTYTETIDLDGTQSDTFTQTYPPGSQTITVYHTFAKSEAPAGTRTVTISYEGTNATRTIQWETGQVTQTNYDTYTATYTVPRGIFGGAFEVSDGSGDAGQPVLRCVDQRRAILDPRTRFGNPRVLALGE